MEFDEKRCHHQRLRWRTRHLCHDGMKNGRRMLRRLGSQKLTAVLHRCFAAVVGICRLAVALLAAILSLLIRLRAGQTVEGPHEQKYCHEGDDDLQTTAHQLSP